MSLAAHRGHFRPRAEDLVVRLQPPAVCLCVRHAPGGGFGDVQRRQFSIPALLGSGCLREKRLTAACCWGGSWDDRRGAGAQQDGQGYYIAHTPSLSVIARGGLGG